MVDVLPVQKPFALLDDLLDEPVLLGMGGSDEGDIVVSFDLRLRSPPDGLVAWMVKEGQELHPVQSRIALVECVRLVEAIEHAQDMGIVFHRVPLVQDESRVRDHAR